MLGKSLKARVSELTNKGDDESQVIQNTFIIMDWFGISYADVMDMPLFAYNEALKYIQEELRKMKDKKPTIKGLKSGWFS